MTETEKLTKALQLAIRALTINDILGSAEISALKAVSTGIHSEYEMSVIMEAFNKVVRSDEKKIQLKFAGRLKAYSVNINTILSNSFADAKIRVYEEMADDIGKAAAFITDVANSEDESGQLEKMRKALVRIRNLKVSPGRDDKTVNDMRILAAQALMGVSEK